MKESKTISKKREKQDKFLKALLVESGVKSRACKIAIVRSRDTIYRWMSEDADFKRKGEEVYQRIRSHKMRKLEYSMLTRNNPVDLIEHVEMTSTSEENLRLAAYLKSLRKQKNARHGKRY